MKKISNLLMMALLTIGMGLTSCDEQLDNAVNPGVMPDVDDVTPTVEEVIKYGFKVTDLNGADKTEAVTSLKMSNEDGTLVAEAEVSGGKITIKAGKLSEITAAADFWFEAEMIGGKPYVAKVNIDPATLSSETPMTLEMATLGDVILSDGKFAAPSSTGTKVAMIAYLGSSTGVEGYTHGLALALSDESTSGKAWLPAAAACSDKNIYAAVTSASWRLPSKDQWDNMINAVGGYGALRDGFSGIAGASNLKSDRYWSSTESGSGSAKSYDFGGGGGYWSDDNKSYDNRVRACLAF